MEVLCETNKCWAWSKAVNENGKSQNGEMVLEDEVSLQGYFVNSYDCLSKIVCVVNDELAHNYVTLRAI